MQKLQTELERLQAEHTRQARAKTLLLAEFNKTATRLEEIESSLPKLMVSAAMGDTPAEKLEAIKAERRKLREDSQDPIQAAIKILNEMAKSSFEKMSVLNQQISMAENKQRYQTARAAITAKGFYTVLEMQELEHLAGNSGDYRDLRRFTHEVDTYRHRLTLCNQAEEIPAFEYVPEEQNA